jgi:hypothetical protein
MMDERTRTYYETHASKLAERYTEVGDQVHQYVDLAFSNCPMVRLTSLYGCFGRPLIIRWMVLHPVMPVGLTVEQATVLSTLDTPNRLAV